MLQNTRSSVISRTRSADAAPSSNQLFGDHTLADWDSRWVSLPGGLLVYHQAYNHKIGLIRLTLNGTDMYIGQAAAREGGIAKRLSDFTRPSASGRDHHAGRLIHAKADQLEVAVLVTGSGHRAIAVAEKLKRPMIRLHDPRWNAPEPAVARARALAYAQSDRS